MVEDYAVKRREYVNEIRKSFEEPNPSTENETVPQDVSVGWIFFKIRMILAVVLFLAFLALQYSNSDVNGYTAKDLIDIVADNHYYTILQDYVMIEKPGEN